MNYESQWIHGGTLRSRDPGGPAARVFVVAVSDWLAPPSQIADRHHVFHGGAVAATSD
jgi:hypothetical protein